MNAKKIYTSQVDERDCGVAALSMILKNYGSSYSIAHLRNLAKTDKEGTTALGLVKTAQILNFNTQAIQANTERRLFLIEKYELIGSELYCKTMFKMAKR